VVRNEYLFEAGYNEASISDLENLAAGVYLLVVKRNGEVYATQKLSKIK